MAAAKAIHTLTGATFSAGLLASFLAAVSKFGNYSDKLKSCTVALPARLPSKNRNSSSDVIKKVYINEPPLNVRTFLDVKRLRNDLGDEPITF
jgi:hypothetical protein